MRKLAILLAILVLALCSCELFQDEQTCTKMHIISFGYDFTGVVIGNSNLRLYGTVNDAVQIGYSFSLLAQEEGMEVDTYYLVGDNLDYVGRGTNRMEMQNVPTVFMSPTKANLESVVMGIAGTAGEDDITVLFMSSHGSNSGHIAVRCKEGHAVSDIDGIDFTQLRTWMNTIPGKKLIMLDCCYSGLIFDQSGVSFNLEMFEGVPVSPFSREPLSVEPDLWCISACEPDNYSYDGRTHGVFTRAVLECIGWDTEYDIGFVSKRKRNITVCDLASYAYLHDNNDSQTPMVTNVSSDLLLFT